MALYLSRLKLRRDPGTDALKALIDPENINDRTDAHHRLLWSVFSDASDRKRDFLWRAESKGLFFALSRRPPLGSGLFDPIESKEFEPNLRPGDRLAFVLRANAVRSISEKWSDPSAKIRERGKKVDIAMHLLKHTPGMSTSESGKLSERARVRYNMAHKASAEWISAQGDRHGFEVQESTFFLKDYSTVEIGSAKRKERRPLKFGVFDMAGHLTIKDSERFINQISLGFGRAKAFGQGLMLVKRA